MPVIDGLICLLGGKQPVTHCALTWNGNIVLNFIDFEASRDCPKRARKFPQRMWKRAIPDLVP